MQYIIIVANLVVKDEFYDEVYEALLKIYKQTHENDRGCIQYELHQDDENRNSFTFIETWKDEACFQEHINKEHLKEFKILIENKLEQRNFYKMKKLNLK